MPSTLNFTQVRSLELGFHVLNGPRPWRRSDGVGSCDSAGVQEDFE